MEEIKKTPAELIAEFLETNPTKRFPDSAFAARYPEKYEAAKELYAKDYPLVDIAKFMGCSYDTLRKTLARDGLYTVKQYRKTNRQLRIAEASAVNAR